MNPLRTAKEFATDKYYYLAKTTPLGKVHNRLRRAHHKRLYGVESSFMFKAVELEVNGACNRACGYCPNSFAKRPKGDMDEALFRKIIDELAEIDFDGRVSYHFYGEPMLDQRLPDFVEYTRKHVPRSYTEIYSNGDYLNVENFRYYVERGLDKFLITQHDSIMTPALQEIMDTISEDEKEHITIRFAKDRNLINRSGLITNLQIINEPLKSACDWPLNIMVITMTGNVVLCCNDYFETEVIGNVREKSLREVWTDPRYVNFRAALSRGDRTVSKLCKDCDYVPSQAKLKRIVPGAS